MKKYYLSMLLSLAALPVVAKSQMVYGDGLIRLQSFQQFRKICQCNNINIREGCLTGYTLNQAVSVKDYLHRLFQFMEIHLVDFVESLLIKFPRLPQFIEPIFHFCRIMAVKYVLQLIEPILTLVQGKHLKQMNLQRIENGCFHNYTFYSRGKGTKII